MSSIFKTQAARRRIRAGYVASVVQKGYSGADQARCCRSAERQRCTANLNLRGDRQPISDAASRTSATRPIYGRCPTVTADAPRLERLDRRGYIVGNVKSASTRRPLLRLLQNAVPSSVRIAPELALHVLSGIAVLAPQRRPH